MDGGLRSQLYPRAGNLSGCEIWIRWTQKPCLTRMTPVFRSGRPIAIPGVFLSRRNEANCDYRRPSAGNRPGQSGLRRSVEPARGNRVSALAFGWPLSDSGWRWFSQTGYRARFGPRRVRALPSGLSAGRPSLLVLRRQRAIRRIIHSRRFAGLHEFQVSGKRGRRRRLWTCTGGAPRLSAVLLPWRPFDPDGLQLSGSPVPLVSDVASLRGRGDFSV